MTLGLLQYVIGRNRLRNVGKKPERSLEGGQRLSTRLDKLTTVLAVAGG
jgi:hypothetical protein